MRKFIAFIAALVFGTSLGASAQDGGRPVMIELFTSQGCSSCPPADALLHDLAQDPDIIALSMHVDYWDYIGWKDVFGSPENTRRQKAYAHAWGSTMIYTPQMVIGGVDQVVGTKVRDVMEAITKARSMPEPVTLTVGKTTEGLRISVAPLNGPVGRSVVFVAEYSPAEVVDIKRGENAGLEARYTNVVRRLRPVIEWGGDQPFDVDVKGDPKAPSVVFIQSEGFGPIIAARQLR